MRSSSVSPYDLQDWAKRAGFELTEETLPPLAGYLGLLMQWNRVMNLVGTRRLRTPFLRWSSTACISGVFCAKTWNTALYLVAGIWAREPGFPDFLCV